MRTIARVLLVTSLGCAGPPKNLIFERTLQLAPGRFVGPIEVEVPRRADHKGRDFEIHATLTAACGPLLRMSFPDGEVSSVGSGDRRWQELLALRAEADIPAETPAPTQDAAPSAPSANPAEAPPYQPGHWRATTTESWSGQIEFLAQRERRCSRAKTYRRSYLNAFDESGRVTFWAETPQEMKDATLTVRVFEIVDEEPPAPPKAKTQVTLAVEPKPIPPRPAPKKESPKQAKAAGARWVPGSWEYVPGRGRWVWYPGYWAQPATVPAGKAEDRGVPPIDGARWQAGYWVWEQGPGQWRWTQGYWDAPPPRVEEPGVPPVPESPWVSGYWVRVGATFEWKAGHWGPPRPRAETPPAPPYEGARWIAGTWMRVKGTWEWSPGFYERSDRPPPAPKVEKPGTPPGSGAVWLAGFWRWNDKRADHDWVPGHWELPPGEGYVWVPDPPPATGGVSVGGHWEIDVDLRVKVKVRP